MLDEVSRFRLFLFILKDKANLARFFLQAKTVKMKNDIYHFLQIDLEPLYEAGERIKDMLRMYPHYGLPNWLV